MTKRKGIMTVKANDDLDLVKYIYFNYDPEEVINIQINAQLGKTYCKGHVIGKITKRKLNLNLNINQQKANVNKQKPNLNQQLPNDKKTQYIQQTQIKILDTGCISQINPILKCQQKLLKKQSLQLFHLNLCAHIPCQQVLKRLISQQFQTNDKKSKKQQKNQPIYCKICNQRIYYFYLQQEVSVKFKEIQQIIDGQDEEDQNNCQWMVVKGQTFTKNTQICKINHNEFKLKQSGKISYLLNWQQHQNVSSSCIVLKYHKIFCQHQKIQQNLCQHCLQQVDPIQLNLKKYLFQMDQESEFKKYMITGGSTLIQQQNQFVDQLIQNHKGVLILDLDNTVLHAIQLNQIQQNRLQHMKDYYQLRMGQQITHYAYASSSFVVKIRPYFKEFVRTIIKYYEIYIYTKGTRMYAEEICNAVRNQYASKYHPTNNKNDQIQYYDFLKDKNAFKTNRIITRDQDPNLEKKSLDNILPNRQENLMVMDDLGSVWNYNPSLLHTIPYYYFFKKHHIQVEKQRLSKIKQQKLQKLQEKPIINQPVQPLLQLPCDHFEKQLVQLQKQQQFQLIQGNSSFANNSKQEFLDIVHAKNNHQYQYDIWPKNDFYLLFATNALVQIHREFFQAKSKPNSQKLTFGQAHRKYKSRLLQGLTIKLYSPNYQKSDIYNRALKMGCKIHNSQTTTPDYSNLSINHSNSSEQLIQNQYNVKYHINNYQNRKQKN